MRYRAKLLSLASFFHCRKRQRALALGVFAVALLVRLVWLFGVQSPGQFVVSDMATYDRYARLMLAGKLRIWETFVPPGYPTFLAAVYWLTDRHHFTVGVLQALMGAATAGLGHLFAYRVTRNGLLALTCGLMIALHLPLLFYSGLLLTEVSTAFTTMLGLWLALRASDRASWCLAAAAGLSLGCGAVIRPNLLLLVPLLALAAAWGCRQRARRIALAAALALMAALPVGAAMAHNSRLTGHFTGTSTNGGLNFYLNFADVKLIKYGNRKRPNIIGPIPNARFKRIEWTERPFHEERYFYRRGFALLAEEPSRLLRMLGNLEEGLGAGKQNFWPGLRGHHRLFRRYGRATFRFLVLPALGAMLWLLLARSFKRRRHLSRLMLSLAVLSMLAAIMVFLGDPRMRVPFDPLLILLAVDGLWRLAGWFDKLYRRRRAARS